MQLSTMAEVLLKQINEQKITSLFVSEGKRTL